MLDELRFRSYTGGTRALHSHSLVTSAPSQPLSSAPAHTFRSRTVKNPATPASARGHGRTDKEFDMGKRIPLAVRLMRRIEVQPDGCWQWAGALDKRSGYGRIQVEGHCRYTHRVAYELLVGEVGEGLQLDHLCRNRACCNPDHLEPVDPWENTHRSPLTYASRATCPEGHPYAGDNLNAWVDKRGYTHRICRTCNRRRSQEWHEQAKAKAG